MPSCVLSADLIIKNCIIKNSQYIIHKKNYRNSKDNNNKPSRKITDKAFQHISIR